MSPLVVLGIGLAGGIGALARFLLDRAVSVRAGRAFPWGTLTVNLTGTFALAVLAAATLSDDAYAIAGTGLVGAYTTFSTWMYEAYRPAEDGELRVGALNIALSLGAGIALAALGHWVGRML